MDMIYKVILKRIDNIFMKIFSFSIINLVTKIKKIFIYTNYDSSEYWKKRAKEPGQAAVLWKNQEYNNLYRKLEFNLLKKFLPKTINEPFYILDIGCGIGIVSKFLVENYPLAYVDAVDFQEMIEIARQKNFHERINYISSEAENYFDECKKYDVVISSACFSAIRNINRLKMAIENCSKMMKKNGIMIMIDHFHKWSYLARAKISSNEIIILLESLGFKLIYKSGVLFWPYREWLANSNYYGKDLERKFFQGEKLLGLLGKHFWADYKVLVFQNLIILHNFANE